MKISLSILKMLCPLLVILPMEVYAKMVSHQITVYNNTQWPLLIWPIPEKAPPYLMATVPQEQPGVITAPARLGWPGNAKAMIVVAAPQMNTFEIALKKAIEEFNRKNKPANFSWHTYIEQHLGSQGVTRSEWTTFYPYGSNMGHDILLEDKDYDLVIYNIPGRTSGTYGDMTGAAAPTEWQMNLQEQYKF